MFRSKFETHGKIKCDRCMCGGVSGALRVARVCGVCGFCVCEMKNFLL